MFVQSNSVLAVRSYFKERLASLFTPSEIKLVANQAIASRLNLSTSELIFSDDLRVSESDLLYFRSIVKRALANEPIQYIFGNTEFYGLELKCDSRALIPRPETEELVDWIVTEFNHQSIEKIADICSGSGCIALALKRNFSSAFVCGIDFSEAAISLSNENALLNQLAVDFYQGDALNKLITVPIEENSFDIWVSNPPYIPLKEKKIMHANVLDYEPEMALFVEDHEALIFYREIALLALKYLKIGGALFFELNENYAEQTLMLITELGFVNVELKLDLQGKKRMLKAIKKS